ncbi:hypothetical protein [Microscilla marina]|uniref:hypothetical protein n=1 Tax=Microscilla marina TaxID=1027 RepID=UPI0012FBF09E|nr:hypothetical protein [Microscilla marina]
MYWVKRLKQLAGISVELVGQNPLLRGFLGEECPLVKHSLLLVSCHNKTSDTYVKSIILFTFRFATVGRMQLYRIKQQYPYDNQRRPSGTTTTRRL